MKVSVSFAESKSNPKDFVMTKKLGESKSEVFRIQSVSEATEEYAIKLFRKDNLSTARFTREKEIISGLSHQNIIKNYPVSSHNSDYDILINEFASRGDFLHLITKRGLDHEVHIRTYFHQLISGLEYLHSKGLAHLDLKLENLLLNDDFTLKITDFDQSRRKQEQERAKRIGTSCYRPPEILEKNCKDFFAADIYSVGILLFIFKARQFPFTEIEEDGKTKLASYDLFMNHNQEFWKVKMDALKKDSKFFSKDFKELLQGMLDKDPVKRFTIQEVKESEWYNKPILDSEHLKDHMATVWERLFEE